MDIEPVSSIDFRLVPYDWPFAAERRDEIAEHWRALAAERPNIWNGRVIMTRDVEVSGGHFHATGFAADYAAFIAWRDWGWPDAEVADCFGSALILSRDGALICGRMAETTLNAGKVYPPCGTLDLKDAMPDGRIDILASLARELGEETGLAAGSARRGRLWCVRDGCLICLAQELRFDEDASALLARAEAFNAAQPRPELAGFIALRSPRDLDPDMPAYAAKLARHVLG